MSSHGLADPLKQDHWTVELHKEMFPGAAGGETPDHEWIPIVSARGLVIITSDKNQQTWRAEGGRVRAAVVASNAKILFLRGVGLTSKEQAQAIVAGRRMMCRLLKKCAGTFLFARIHSRGTRLGEVQHLIDGGTNKADRKYGTRIRDYDN